jgi:hypothetical protein
MVATGPKDCWFRYEGASNQKAVEVEGGVEGDS